MRRSERSRWSDVRRLDLGAEREKRGSELVLCGGNIATLDGGYALIQGAARPSMMADALHAEARA
jgi:hypothetical protein